MTKSQLPEITLTCGNGHSFTTRARAGQSVGCKTCGKSKRVPRDRPQTAREAADYRPVSQDQDQDQDPGAELVGRWQAEPAWTGTLTVRPGRDQDECPECGEPLHWEPRRTLAYCQECEHADVPPAVSEHYERQASQQTAVAVREQANPIAQRAERARLRALIEQAEQWAEAWLETVGDPDAYDRSQWQRSAREFGTTMRGWLPEIRSAESEAELAAIKSHIVTEILNSEPGKALKAEYHDAIARAEQAEERRQRAEAIEQAEAERERQRRTVTHTETDVRQVATPRVKAITAGSSGPAATVARRPQGLESVAVLIGQMQAMRADAIEQRGKCEFGHMLGAVPAARAYGIPHRDMWGRLTGYSAPNTPQIRACSKHFGAAESALNQQGYSDLTWWDLNAS